MTAKQHLVSLVYWLPAMLIGAMVADYVGSWGAFVLGGVIALSLHAIDNYLYREGQP